MIVAAILLDGAKNLYPSILSLLEGRLRAGALIVADNADASPEYLARVRSTGHGYLSVPFADHVELSTRLEMAVPPNDVQPHAGLARAGAEHPARHELRQRAFYERSATHDGRTPHHD